MKAWAQMKSCTILLTFITIFFIPSLWNWWKWFLTDYLFDSIEISVIELWSLSSLREWFVTISTHFFHGVMMQFNFRSNHFVLCIVIITFIFIIFKDNWSGSASFNWIGQKSSWFNNNCTIRISVLSLFLISHWPILLVFIRGLCWRFLKCAVAAPVPEVVQKCLYEKSCAWEFIWKNNLIYSAAQLSP